MEFILVILGLAVLIVVYFLFGIIIKFVVAWWMLVLGTPILLVIGFYLGWIGAFVVLVGFGGLLRANNEWLDTRYYLALEKKIDKAFYLSDT